MLLNSDIQIKVNIEPHKITEFFKYRQSPRIMNLVCRINLDGPSSDKILDTFEKTKYYLENHCSWIQEDGFLYVYSDGRLDIGQPDKTGLMFVQ